MEDSDKRNLAKIIAIGAVAWVSYKIIKGLNEDKPVEKIVKEIVTEPVAAVVDSVEKAAESIIDTAKDVTTPIIDTIKPEESPPVPNRDSTELLKDKPKHKGHKTKKGLSQDQKLVSEEKHEIAYQKKKKKKKRKKYIKSGKFIGKYKKPEPKSETEKLADNPKDPDPSFKPDEAVIENWGKEDKPESDIPYADDVTFYANKDKKSIITVQRTPLNQGWYMVRVGEHSKKSRDTNIIPMLRNYYPNYVRISLFAETSYHSKTGDETGKITKYGTNDYTLQYSSYKPLEKYKLEQPIKTQTKENFGKVLHEVELSEWTYFVLNWIPEEPIKFQIEHSISTPFDEENIFKSKIYTDKEEAITEFKKYVKEHK